MSTKLITKLRTLGLNTSLCNCILDLVMCRPKVVRLGNSTSATLPLNTGAPLGWVLRPLVYPLFTHSFVPKHDSNTIIKFADDTTVVGLITDNNETVWCHYNNLSLNVTAQAPILIDRAVMEQVESVSFLGVHITNKLSWSKHTNTVVKRA